jgi:hypothetical protein
VLVEGHIAQPLSYQPFFTETLIAQVLGSKPVVFHSGNQIGSVTAASIELPDGSGSDLRLEVPRLNKACPCLGCLDCLAGYLITSKQPGRHGTDQTLLFPDICTLANGNFCKEPGKGCFMGINDLSLHEHNYPGKIPYLRYDLLKYLGANMPFNIFRS